MALGAGIFSVGLGWLISDGVVGSGVVRDGALGAPTVIQIFVWGAAGEF